MLRSTRVSAFALSIVLMLIAVTGLAHHATAPAYDLGRIIELDGEITAVSWRNPHIHLTLQSSGEGGEAASWDLETNSVSVVSRFGLSADLVAPGTRVRVAGSPGRIKEHALWLTNVLLEDGREILFGSAYLPRWSERTVGATDMRGAITPDVTGSLGIFRVWTSIGGGGVLWNDSYPFTPEVAAFRAAFDPVRDDPTLNCALKGMPLIMEQPYPMEFVDQGDEIRLRLEEYDTVRRIALTDHATVRARPASILGNSTGRWEDGVLVVETTGVNYPWFNKTGIPQSEAVHIVERFELNADGSRLEYEMTVTDPATFTEPVVLTKSWGYRPNDEVRPYECAPSE